MNLSKNMAMTYPRLYDLLSATASAPKIAPHFSHFSLQEALDLFARIGAKESYITHLSHLLPCHADFAAMLPPHVHPAYDGLVLESQ